MDEYSFKVCKFNHFHLYHKFHLGYYFHMLQRTLRRSNLSFLHSCKEVLKKCGILFGALPDSSTIFSLVSCTLKVVSGVTLQLQGSHGFVTFDRWLTVTDHALTPWLHWYSKIAQQWKPTNWEPSSGQDSYTLYLCVKHLKYQFWPNGSLRTWSSLRPDNLSESSQVDI